MDNVKLLPIHFDYNDVQQTITPVLIYDDFEKILVDCGYPGMAERIEASLKENDVSLAQITKLIVTHHDSDHIGSLASIKQSYPQVEIVSFLNEKEYIEGKKKSLRQEQAESTLDDLSQEAKRHAEQFIAFLASIEAVEVDITVNDRERLPWCNGIQVVHTPGHMPGHISLYVEQSKTLIAGDAIVIEQGKLEIANPQYTLDLPEAIRSVKKLQELDIEHLICYHGGLFTGNVKEGLNELYSSYQANL
ncbi:MBL fold metallo-hydrolase [Fictibacillus iocasae]|uniref:MBL fold metallo-hydrolase n=1 Tax=Fictibacillus iocasae TaxID=2715437 RepID=A0ABW2NJI6_9BACL